MAKRFTIGSVNGEEIVVKPGKETKIINYRREFDKLMNTKHTLWERLKTIFKLFRSLIFRLFYFLPVATEAHVLYEGDRITIVSSKYL